MNFPPTIPTAPPTTPAPFDYTARYAAICAAGYRIDTRGPRPILVGTHPQVAASYTRWLDALTAAETAIADAIADKPAEDA